MSVDATIDTLLYSPCAIRKANKARSVGQIYAGGGQGREPAGHDVRAIAGLGPARPSTTTVKSYTVGDPIQARVTVTAAGWRDAPGSRRPSFRLSSSRWSSGCSGLLIGSFLNVVVWRVPRGESVVHPPSACPRCGHAIRRARQRARACRGCCCAGGAATAARRSPPGTRWSSSAPASCSRSRPWFARAAWILPAFLYLAAISVALALIDLDTKRLPDAIVLPSYAVGSRCWRWPLDRARRLAAPAACGLGAAVLFAVYFVRCSSYPAGMGFGDVKLAGVLGLYLGWVGWGALVVGWFAAFLLGGLFSVVLLVLGRAGRKSGIPFGPWMLLGAAVGIVVGEQLWDGYLGVALTRRATRRWRMPAQGSSPRRDTR